VNFPNVLAVIPARGGSKRIPRKNIKLIDGMPLIGYTILASKKSKLITDCIVSTDDVEIAEAAKKLSGNVPFIRPKELATDEVRNSEVLIHSLEYMEDKRNIKYDIVLLLQPTCPNRKAGQIDEAILRLHNSSADTIAGIKGPYKKRDPILKKIDENGMLKNIINGDIGYTDEFYLYNACLYGVKREYLLKHVKFTSCNEIPILMEDRYSIDIDNPFDVIVAEAVMQNER